MYQAKPIWQKRFEYWKDKANHLISGTEPVEDEPIELTPLLMEKCKEMAEAGQMTVNELVQHIVEQYWIQRSIELSVPISREHIDSNPLFLLDGLTARNLKPEAFGESRYD